MNSHDRDLAACPSHRRGLFLSVSFFILIKRVRFLFESNCLDGIPHGGAKCFEVHRHSYQLDLFVPIQGRETTRQARGANGFPAEAAGDSYGVPTRSDLIAKSVRAEIFNTIHGGLIKGF
jgi:hypothetical protein